MTERDYSFWDLLLTRALPIVITLIGGYLLLFADARYVKKADYENRGQVIQEMKTDLEVIKNTSSNMAQQLDRIERRIAP